MKTYVVENGVQANEMISVLKAEGYSKDEIYLFAHDLTRSKHLTEHTDTNDIGLTEEGMFDKIARVFRSRGEYLQIIMASIGVSLSEAVRLEKELDEGKVVIVAQ